MTRAPAPLRPGQLVETRTGRIARLIKRHECDDAGAAAWWSAAFKGLRTDVSERDILPLEESTLQHLLRAKAGATALGEHGIAAEIANVLEHAAGRVRQAVDGPDEPHIVRGDQ